MFRLSHIIFFVSYLFSFAHLNAQEDDQFSDGPYIFNYGDSLQIQWVSDGKGYDTTLATKDAKLFQSNNLPIVDLSDLEFEQDDQAIFKDVSSFIAISDVHGQYDILINLLHTHRAIDDKNNWIFDNGHVIILGDNFDRGDQVLNILWFLFKLQKQAQDAGGRVHILLGNHEMMVLHGDLRYLHKKYIYTSAAFTTRYQDFFKAGSVLGDWIAGHPVAISVNGNLFTHAGISPQVQALDLSLAEINEIFRNQIVRNSPDSIQTDPIASTLYFDNGPLWYRGYFTDDTLRDSTIDLILNEYNADRMIVGHTSFQQINPVFDQKIIGVDCSIKLGVDGQLLLFQDSLFYICESDGARYPLKPVKSEKPSLYETIYELEARPKITLTTDIDYLIKHCSDEQYQPASFVLQTGDDKIIFQAPGRVRARGNIRKVVCYFPPLKFDFSKSLLDSIGYFKNDKLKFVLPCSARTSSAELLLKEYFLYTLYDLISPHGMRAKLVDVFIESDKKESYAFVGILLEDEKEYARRKNAVIVESGKLKSGGLDRESFLKMAFFQYMISNTDWTVGNKHNLEIVKLPDMDRVIGLPYDFDYSGFVGQEYALPYESLPITSVHQRYFHPYHVTEAEYYEMVNYYSSMKDRIYAHCDAATYLSEKTRRSCKAYLGSFFKLLAKPEKLKRQIVRNLKK